MGISLKTHKMIWGRSGNMCSFPDCKKVLVIDETATDDPSVIGEEAHIVAQKEEGPRGKSLLSLDQRDKYDNLILLCSIHHKNIDDQENEYTVTKLHEFKKKHESWVKENLTVDKRKIKDDEIYATYIERFIELTDLDNWRSWTSWMLGATESFPKEQFDSLQEIPNYIISRIWPKRYTLLESSIMNFKNIVNDLMKVFYVYPKEGKNAYMVEKFYKNYYRENFRDEKDYSREEEQKALERYQYHLALLEDLIIELTRAINYICDQIREFIFEGFRLEEGAVLISRGDFLGYQTYRVEYRGEERTDYPYPGLKAFMSLRASRDLRIGEGVEDAYFQKLPWD
jgi:hypothetical protein